MRPRVRLDAPLFWETARYGVVVVLGLVMDLGVAMAANRWLLLPLILCSAIGFLVGVAFNYVLVERWVLRTRRYALARLGKAYIAGSGALLTRLVTVVGLEHLFSTGDLSVRLAILLAAAGFSFVVNFALLKRFLV